MTQETIIARLLSVNDAAKYLAISDRTLWNLTAEKKIPAVKINRCVRYDIHDLDEFINRMKNA